MGFHIELFMLPRVFHIRIVFDGINIAPTFNHADLKPALAHLFGHPAAGHAGADDNYVKIIGLIIGHYVAHVFG